jgi:hypothetical protein
MISKRPLASIRNDTIGAIHQLVVIALGAEKVFAERLGNSGSVQLGSVDETRTDILSSCL